MRYAIIRETPHKVIAKCDKIKTCKAIIDDEETQDLIENKKHIYKIYDNQKERFVECK